MVTGCTTTLLRTCVQTRQCNYVRQISNIIPTTSEPVVCWHRLLGGIPHGMRAFPPFDSSAAASDAEAVADIVLGGFEEAPAVQTEPKRQRKRVMT